LDSHWRAFGSLFFLLHQDRLLWLLNAPVIGRWFRRVLRISGDSSSVGSLKIDRILPHAIFWWHGDKQVAEFRTHAKFSKRLYYAFRPLWWTLHAWDWCVADRWVPRLSFQFSTLTKYPDADPETNTVDGWVNHDYGAGGGQAWATLVAAAGTGAGDDGASCEYIDIASDSGSGNWRRISRVINLFYTSALTGSAVISDAVLSAYGISKDDPLSATPDLDVYVSAPASNTALAAGDYDSIGSTSQTGSPITYANLSTGYMDWTFDATGRSGISKTGISKYGFRNANHDVANSAPTWAASLHTWWTAYLADQTGTANDPKLVVTYTIPESYITITKNWALE
jgi:hypothetical protein